MRHIQEPFIGICHMDMSTNHIDSKMEETNNFIKKVDAQKVFKKFLKFEGVLLTETNLAALARFETISTDAVDVPRSLLENVQDK